MFKISKRILKKHNFPSIGKFEKNKFTKLLHNKWTKKAIFWKNIQKQSNFTRK